MTLNKEEYEFDTCSSWERFLSYSDVYVLIYNMISSFGDGIRGLFFISSIQGKVNDQDFDLVYHISFSREFRLMLSIACYSYLFIFDYDNNVIN